VRLDEVTAEIRPRSDWEAVDLGFALVRRDFWCCFCGWWLAVLVPTVVAGVLLWNHPLWLLVLFWWWKPAGSRMVLFELSRRLFGERPPWRSVWREIPRVWQRRFFHRFLWARFSPWLPVTLAIEDLEGLRGKAYRQRTGQIVRRGEGVVMWIYFASDLVAAWLGLAILGLVLMFIPEGQDGAWQLAVDSWNPDEPMEIPLLVLRTAIGCVMLAISLTDVFMIGAGFGIYINNRTWIEGWDVELAFKRMAQRLTKAVVLAVALLVFVMPARGRADEPRKPAEVILEVKAHPDFKVHTVKEWEPKKKKPGTPLSWLAGVGQAMAYLFGICAAAVLLGLVGWVLWKYRHAFLLRGTREKLESRLPTARVVMGMEVSSASLPEDVPTAAWTLWQQGRQHEALALLYRGSISRVIELVNVEIQESDTEGDCLRRVECAGHAAQPGYFRSITGAWIRLAYAGVSPADEEVHQLCRQWPFGERRER
jgi:hypothetical protein